MLRRSLAIFSMAAGLLTTAGCMCTDLPVFPRRRRMLPGPKCPCPPLTAYDAEGPTLEQGDSAPVASGTNGGPPPDALMPQPRLVPQPLTAPSAQPMPYVPPKD